MSNNTIIQITEIRAGGWEVCHRDIGTGNEIGRTSAGLYSNLDKALDKAQTMDSEYGLEIVRLKDQEKPADIILAEAAQAHVLSLLPSSGTSVYDKDLDDLVGWKDVVEAFIQGAGYQEKREPFRTLGEW